MITTRRTDIAHKGVIQIPETVELEVSGSSADQRPTRRQTAHTNRGISDDIERKRSGESGTDEPVSGSEAHRNINCVRPILGDIDASKRSGPAASSAMVDRKEGVPNLVAGGGG